MEDRLTLDSTLSEGTYFEVIKITDVLDSLSLNTSLAPSEYAEGVPLPIPEPADRLLLTSSLKSGIYT